MTRFVQESAIDHFTGRVIQYPQRDAAMKFDFLMRKPGGEWHYLNSTNDSGSSMLDNQIAVTEKSGGEWRLIAAAFGYVVRGNA